MEHNMDELSSGLIIITAGFLTVAIQAQSMVTRESLSVEVSQNPAPLGEDIDLTCSGIKDVAKMVNITWMRNGHKLQQDPGIQMIGNTLKMIGFKSEQSGIYTCMTKEMISQEVNIEYKINRPELSVGDNSVLLGQPFVLVCTTKAFHIKYVWKKDAKIQDNIGNSMLDQVMTPDKSGFYTCAISNDNKISEESYKLYIGHVVPTPVLSTTNNEHLLGSSFDLTCTTSYPSKQTYEREYSWFNNGDLQIYDETRHTLTISNFHYDQAGTYRCVESIEQTSSQKSNTVEIRYKDFPAVAVQDFAAQYTTESDETEFLEDCIILIDIWTNFTLECADDYERYLRDNLVVTGVDWLHDSTVLEDHHESYISLLMLPSTAGNYSCIKTYNQTIVTFGTTCIVGYQVNQPTILRNQEHARLGSTFTMECKSSIAKPLATTYFNWYKDEIPVVDNDDYDVSNNILRIKKFSTAFAGHYQCDESLVGISSERSDQFYLANFVVPSPVINVRSADGSNAIPLGEDISLTCVSNGGKAASVGWTRNQVKLEWDDSTEVHDMLPNIAGVYSCRVLIDDQWSDWGSGTDVTFQVPTPRMTSDKNEGVVQFGESIEFKCDNTFQQGEIESSVIWLKNGNEFAQEGLDNSFSRLHINGNVAVLTTFQVDDKGNYACKVSVSGVKSQKSNILSIRAEVPPPVINIMSGNGSNAIPIGEDLTLTCVSNGGRAALVGWRRNQVELEWDDSTEVHDMQPHLAGGYNCRVLIDDEWSDWGSGTDVTFQVPTPRMTSDKNEGVVLLGESIRFTCENTFQYSEVQSNVIWMKDGNEYEHEGDEDIVPRVHINGNVAILSTFQVDDKGNYTCKVSVSGVKSQKSNILSIRAEVPPPKLVYFEQAGRALASSTFLLGSDVALNCSSSLTGITYSWNKDGDIVQFQNEHRLHGPMDPSRAGTYKCRVFLHEMDQFSQWSDTVALSYEVPTPSIKSSNNIVYIGEEVRLECYTSYEGDAVRQFKWFHGGSAITPDQQKYLSRGTHVLLVEHFEPGLNGHYQCSEVIQGIASSKSTELSIEFAVKKPVIYIRDSNGITGTSFPVGSNVTLYCNTTLSGTPEDFINWKKDGTNLNGKLVTRQILLHPGMEGMYECQGVVEGFVTSPYSERVQLSYSVPTPLFIADKEFARAGETVTIKCMSSYKEFPLNREFIWFHNSAREGLNHSQYQVNDTTIGEAIFQLDNDGIGTYQCQERMGTVLSGLSSHISLTLKGNASSANDNHSSHDNNNLQSERDADPRPYIRSNSKPTVPEHSKVKLDCSFDASHKDTMFHWYKDGMQFESSNRSVAMLDRFSRRMNGNYSCGVSYGDETLLSTTMQLVTVDANALCSCPCDNTTKAVNITETEMEEMLTTLQKNLTVDTTTLSAKIRTKTSAPDHRPSSIGTGSVAIAIIIFVPSFVVSLDILNLITYLATRSYSPKAKRQTIIIVD